MFIDFRKRRAFTLLEIVLVVAILFLFILLLIPAFHKGKPLTLAPETTPAPAATHAPEATPLTLPPAATKPPAAPPVAPEPAAPAANPETEKPAEPAPSPEADKPMASTNDASLSAEEQRAIDHTVERLNPVIFPKFEMREATRTEALRFLQLKAAERNVRLETAALPPQSPESQITVSLTNIPFLEALRYVTSLADLKAVIKPWAIAVLPQEAAIPPGSIDLVQIGQPSAQETLVLSKEAKAKIEAKLAGIVIPKLELHGATIKEAIEFLRKKAGDNDREPDPARRGVGLVLKMDSPAGGAPPPAAPVAPQIPGLEPLPVAPAAAAAGPQVAEESRITLSLTNVSYWDALKAVCAQAKLKVGIEAFGVAIVPLEELATANVASASDPEK